MRIFLAFLVGFLLSAAASAQTEDQALVKPEDYLIWTEPQIAQLQQLVDARAAEGGLISRVVLRHPLGRNGISPATTVILIRNNCC